MYRLYETIPGILLWTTFVLMFVLSHFLPAYVAVFIILFDIYWLLKTIYLSLHLRATFSAMRKNMKVDWLRRLEEASNAGASEMTGWQSIHHLIVFPMYLEPYEVVRESFVRLAETNYPKEKFIVVLAIEARAGNEARRTAERIEKEFAPQFGAFLVAVHPKDIQGEIPGKGSNETWGVREAKKKVVDAKRIPETHVLVSVFDIDTQVYAEYFGRLTYVFLHVPDRLRAIYQPIPLFTNNIYATPALARVVSNSATFWQMMQQSRAERLTSFSSQSIPLKTLIDIGYWNTNIVSEDSRIFWQGFMRYDGEFRCEPLVYPVSMDANAAPTLWESMKNLYKQQRRWAWGVENTPYILDGFQKNPRIPTRKKWYWGFIDLEGRHSWATNAIIIFALGYLPIFFGGRAFNGTLLSYNLPKITELIVRFSMVGVATSAILALMLLPPKPRWFRPHHYILYFFEWLLMPVTLIVFGCIPAIDAETRLMLGGKWRLGFWVTPKHRKGAPTA